MSYSRKFSSSASLYQLAYCQTIIERNNRTALPVVGHLCGANVTGKPLLVDWYFPFDPFLLPLSRPWVADMYREYREVEEDQEEEEEEDYGEEEDGAEGRSRRRHDSLGSVRSTRSRNNSISLSDFLLL